MTGRGAAALALAVAVLFTGCGGDDGDDAAKESDGLTTTTAPAGVTTSTTAAAPATTPTTARPGATTTTTRAPVTTSTTSAPVTPGIPFTPTGTYRYRSTGEFTSTLTGPQPRNGEVTLQVDPPSGSDQRTLRRAFSRTTEQVLRFDASGVHLVYLRLSDQGIDKAVEASPPVLALPADAAPGRRWTWRLTSTDGLTTADSSFRVLRNEPITIGGERVDAVVVEVVLSLSGDVVATLTQTVWVDMQRRLVLRQDEASQGRFGVVTFTGSTSDTLVSLTPG